MSVPASLRVWFVIHFIIDFIFGIPLLFFPAQILRFAGWPAIDVFSARLVGAALLGIGGISLLARNAERETYRNLLGLKIIWSVSAIVGIILSLPGYPLFGWLALILFAVFSIIWIYYRLRI